MMLSSTIRRRGAAVGSRSFQATASHFNLAGNSCNSRNSCDVRCALGTSSAKDPGCTQASSATSLSTMIDGGRLHCTRHHANRLMSPLSFQSPSRHSLLNQSRWFATQGATSPEHAHQQHAQQRDTGRKLRRFDQIDSLHPSTLDAIHAKGLEVMTEIQDRTFDVAVAGEDVVGRARTGTGKTLAFLLPTLESILRNPTAADQVDALIISPTRELAIQIANEASDLLAKHGNQSNENRNCSSANANVTSQVMYGGSSKRRDIQQFQSAVPNILIATPGRLKDHFEGTEIDGSPFQSHFRSLQVLVLDEMDRLLDLGFRDDIAQLVSYLPNEKRQTLLFSATMPPRLRSDIHQYIRQDAHQIVDCIANDSERSSNDAGEQVMPGEYYHRNIDQSAMILRGGQFFSGSLEAILKLIDDPKNKVIVFFPMTIMVQLYTTIVSHGFGRRVFELHGKLPQQSRSLISDRFRKSTNGTLFTTDVSARGVDYPDVTHVVQLGAAETRETYMHRLGRTGRASKRGHGLLLLPTVQQRFLASLDAHHMDIQRAKRSLSRKFVNELGPLASCVRKGDSPKLEKLVADTYYAMLKYYLQLHGTRYADDIVETVNAMVRDIGMIELPPIKMKQARNMRVEGVDGLNIQQEWHEQKRWTGSWVQHSVTRTNQGGQNSRLGDSDDDGYDDDGGEFDEDHSNMNGATRRLGRRGHRNSQQPIEDEKYLTYSQVKQNKVQRGEQKWNARMGVPPTRR